MTKIFDPKGAIALFFLILQILLSKVDQVWQNFNTNRFSFSDSISTNVLRIYQYAQCCPSPCSFLFWNKSHFTSRQKHSLFFSLTKICLIILILLVVTSHILIITFMQSHFYFTRRTRW